MYSNDVKEELRKYAEDADFKNCEKLIEKYHIPFEIGKECFEILTRIYREDGRPHADLFEKYSRNKEKYEKDLLNIEKSKNYPNQKQSKNSKDEKESPFYDFFKQQEKLLDAEKQAQEKELDSINNKNFDFLKKIEPLTDCVPCP